MFAHKSYYYRTEKYTRISESIYEANDVMHSHTIDVSGK